MYYNIFSKLFFLNRFFNLLKIYSYHNTFFLFQKSKKIYLNFQFYINHLLSKINVFENLSLILE